MESRKNCQKCLFVLYVVYQMALKKKNKKRNEKKKTTCTFLKTIIIAKILVFSITDANIILAEFRSIYKIGKD